MLDRKLLRTNFDEINKRLEHRGEDLSDLVKFGELDEKRRELISKVEELKAERNEATKQISELKKNKEDATDAITAMRALGGEIKEHDNELMERAEKIDRILLFNSNIRIICVPIVE